jgi:hypothetical protein
MKTTDLSSSSALPSAAAELPHLYRTLSAATKKPAFTGWLPNSSRPGYLARRLFFLPLASFRFPHSLQFTIQPPSSL